MLRKRAVQENWTKEKKEVAKQDNTDKSLSDIDKQAQKLLGKLSQAITQLDKQNEIVSKKVRIKNVEYNDVGKLDRETVVEDSERRCEVFPTLVNVNRLRLLASTLKDLKIIKGHANEPEDADEVDKLSEAMYTLAKELEQDAE